MKHNVFLIISVFLVMVLALAPVSLKLASAALPELQSDSGGYGSDDSGGYGSDDSGGYGSDDSGGYGSDDSGGYQ